MDPRSPEGLRMMPIPNGVGIRVQHLHDNRTKGIHRLLLYNRSSRYYKSSQCLASLVAGNTTLLIMSDEASKEALGT